MRVVSFAFMFGVLCCVQVTYSQNCSAKVDIGFIIDESESILISSAKNWDFIKQFVNLLITPFPISPTGTRIGIVKFSTSASLTFGFSQYNDTASLINVTSGLTMLGGKTNYAAAFRVANTQLFNQRRHGVRSICIMITDGKPTVELENTFIEINKTKTDGIVIFAIGVTNETDQNLLRQVASVTDNVSHYYYVTDFSGLSAITAGVTSQSCSVALATQPPTTTNTSTTRTTTTTTTTMTTTPLRTPLTPTPTTTANNINECASNPCQNGGFCIDGINAYTCDCSAGYTEEGCQTNINECASNPCKNGGLCIDGITAYTCDCLPGYTEEDCQTNINECASSPCHNSGSCIDDINGYTCFCVPGYTGVNCLTTQIIQPVSSGTIDVIGTLYGPLAGGTRFTIVGHSLAMASTNYTNFANATISTVYIGIYTATVVYVTYGKLEVVTPPANRSGFEKIVLVTVNGELLDTRRTFEYRNITWVNDMQPRQHLFEGGTVIDVTGVNIDWVSQPGISTTVIVTRWNDTHSANVTGSSNTTNIERCLVINSTLMQCIMPVVPLPPDFPKNETLHSNVPGVAAFIGPNGKDRADVYIGLILDGDSAYNDISNRLPNVKLSFFERPPLDCRQTNAKFNPKSDTSIAIKGSYLTRGNRLIDVKVTIGVGVCNVTKLTDNEIVCKPPVEVPNKGNNTLCPNDGSLPVEVFIGFAAYHCSCLQYYSSSSNVPLIVGLVVGLGAGLIVILIVIAVILVKIRRRRKKKQLHTADEYNRKLPNEPTDEDIIATPTGYPRTVPGAEYHKSGGAYAKTLPGDAFETSGDA